jgi:hypothetical protein
VSFARRLLYSQPLVPPIELMEFQVHGPLSVGAHSRTAPIASCGGPGGSRSRSPTRPVT